MKKNIVKVVDMIVGMEFKGVTDTVTASWATLTNICTTVDHTGLRRSGMYLLDMHTSERVLDSGTVIKAHDSQWVLSGSSKVWVK